MLVAAEVDCAAAGPLVTGSASMPAGGACFPAGLCGGGGGMAAAGAAAAGAGGRGGADWR